jgi:chemotaxis protein histidine kinase CheA
MVMAVDPYTERLGRVRQRFVSALESKIEDSYAAIPDLSGDAPEVVETVEETYRRIHGIVGIGPTVGFAGTGRAARSVENILLPPHQAERGLTREELDSFKKALHALREIATRELQSFYSGWR